MARVSSRPGVMSSELYGGGAFVAGVCSMLALDEQASDTLRIAALLVGGAIVITYILARAMCKCRSPHNTSGEQENDS